VHKGILFFKAIIFKLHIPKGHKHFGTNIYKLCGTTGYTYNMNVPGKGQTKCNKDQAYLMTYTQEVSTVVGLSQKIIKECQRVLIIRH
jgi:hypothetical protein